MAIWDYGPFDLQTLGATLRVVDKNGGDVAVLGRADDPDVRDFGKFIREALNSMAWEVAE